MAQLPRTRHHDLRAAGVGILTQVCIAGLIALIALVFAEDLHSENSSGPAGGAYRLLVT